MSSRYLWTPLQLGPVETRNRIVFSAHLTNYARDGRPTAQHAAYYAARAAGGTGLIITSLIGSSINATTGNYSRGASGFWVENGEVTGPVNECTVAGNLRPMLASLIAANDAQDHKSSRIPSLLVQGLTIAGA